MAAPSRMMKTMEVVFAVSSITPRSVSSSLRVRQPDHTMETRKPKTAMAAKAMPRASRLPSMFLMFRSKNCSSTMMAVTDTTARMAG